MPAPKRTLGNRTYTPPRQGRVLPGLSDSRNHVTLGSRIEVIGRCCHFCPFSEASPITTTENMRGDARNQVIVQARAYAIVRDPNFETLRMLEIKEALEPSKSTRNFPTSGCNMKVCPTEKKLIVNELLDLSLIHI